MTADAIVDAALSSYCVGLTAMLHSPETKPPKVRLPSLGPSSVMASQPPPPLPKPRSRALFLWLC